MSAAFKPIHVVFLTLAVSPGFAFLGSKHAESSVTASSVPASAPLPASVFVPAPRAAAAAVAPVARVTMQ